MRTQETVREPAREFAIFVRVRDAVTAQPIQWASVNLLTKVGATARTANTDSNGSAEIERIPPGAYILLVRHPEYREYRSEEVALVQGRITVQRFDFVLQPLKSPEATPGPDQQVSTARLLIPKKAQKEFEKGLKELNERGRPRESLEHFRKATEFHSEFDEAYNQWALAHLLLEELDDSEAVLTAALEANDQNSRAHALLGIVYRRKEKLDESERHLSRSVDLSPENALSHIEFARTLLELKDFPRALTHARRSHELDPSPPDIHLVLFTALVEQQMYPEALSELEEFIQRYPTEPRLGEVQVQKERLEEFLKNRLEERD